MKHWPIVIYMLFCFTAAMLLEVIGWGTMQWLAPAWVFVFLLFFTTYYPNLFNVGLAWFLGLLMDAWTGEWLGKHALIFVVVTFIVHFSLGGFTKMTYIAKLIVIMALVFLYNITLVVLSENSMTLWAVWLPAVLGSALSSALLWCALSLFVRRHQI